MLTKQAIEATQTVAVTAAVPASRVRPTAAIIAIHGMGEQTRNDTLSGIADILLEEAAQRTGRGRPHTIVSERALTTCVRAMCADFTIETAQGTKDVHVFETY